MITGAGSGIGRALAIALADSGAVLAVSDVDEDGLRETVNTCSATDARVRTDIVDVTDRDRVSRYADDVAEQFGRVDLHFNNAGIIYTGGITQTGYEDLQKVIAVDFWGVVHGTMAFLPHLIASGDGHLINISSAFGLIAAPYYSAYNAAKFGVRGFTEAIQQEMKLAGLPVHVSCVFPGAVRTTILRKAGCAEGLNNGAINAGFDRMARTTPEQAAARILRGVPARKRRILIGPDAVVADLASRLPGTGYQRVLELARYLRGGRTAGSP